MAEKPANDSNEMSGVDESSVVYGRRSWPGPRTVVVPKADEAFGFTLRHLVIQPPEKTSSVDVAPTEGDDDCVEDLTLADGERGGNTGSGGQPMETIFVKQVKEDSKAHSAGLRTGDRIVSINGVNVAGKTYSQVIRLIHGSDSALTLMVIPKDEDVLQMAYKTADDAAKEISGRNPSVLSTCRVSLSPATHRRGQELYNRNSAATSSQANSMEGRFLADEYRSGSPSLHIRVHINPAVSQNRHSDSGAGSVLQSATFNSKELPSEVWIRSGSFYPVTATARKTRPEDYVSSTEQLLVNRDEQRNVLTAAKLRTSRMSALASEADNPATSEHQRSSFTYNLMPLQSTDACTLRQSPKLTSYREITLSQMGDCGGPSISPRLLAAQQTVVPRASAQESSRLSSHFIHMAPPGGPLGVSMHLDVGSPVAINSISPLKSSASVVGARQQMFVSARPQSYESLFGHSRLDQVPPVSCSLSGTASKSSSELMDKPLLSPRQPPATTAASAMPRLSSVVDQPRANLVAERMRRFESGDNVDGSRNTRSSKLDEELSAIGGCPQFGYDSVAKRAAQFEQGSAEDARQVPADAQGRRNILDSLKVYRAPASLDQSKELWSSLASPSAIGSRQVPSSVTIPLYFRADPSTSSSKSTSPSLNHHGEPAGPSVYGTSGESGGGGALAVVSSSESGSADKRAGIHSQEIQAMAKVSCRQLTGHQERTGVEKAADGSCAMTVESISQSTTLAMAATLGIKEQLFAGETFEPPSSPALINTPAKSGNSNIKKFVAFFTDKKTVDATVDKKSATDATATGGSITIEGCLNCKAAVAEGKKASDRSWKPFWAVLRGHFLGLYKDRYSLTSGSSEEQSVCVRSSSVEVAVDYVKKRNVFQVTTASGSKFLFQAEDPESMSNWVKAIQSNSESKETEQITSSTMTTLSQNLQRPVGTVEKTSPQVAAKAKKQSSKIIPVSKSPASPVSKSRKAGFSGTDSVESPRVKEHKTWKGKMVKKFGRHRSGSGATVEMCDDQEPTGTFGVPLDACPPSLFNECVPLIVETCTRIVEERGIENQGIYRVPGNSCAVNTLRDELNRFPENIDAECDKWQDVNVVSSLLKLFFRKLPDSLITDELYEPVITAYRLQNPEKKMLKLKKLLHDLPEHNFETFRFLAQHLNRVAGREDINKMDARNLAIVFGPTLVRPQDQSVVLMVKDMSDQCRVVETIIVNVDWFFSSWDEDVNVPLAEENEPISSINSELLAKAENLMNPTEMTRDLSAKDLVSSILHAANKKIRRKDRNKSAESIETEGESDVSYSDRNIDQEMEIQGMRELLESGSHMAAFAVTSSSTVISSSIVTPAGCSSSVSTETTKTRQHAVAIETSMGRVAGKLSIAQAKSASDVKRYPAYHFDPVGTTAETENSKPKILRRYSEDAFGITTPADHDEVTLRPFMRDGSLVEHAEQQLRRLHLDTRALYHKQELERREREKRAIAKERVEREFSKTIQELELEEAESNSPSMLAPDAATSSGDGSSVRSAMDRCKLAMYENRLRFFTDFGDRKAFSPVFRQDTAMQSSSSASVSPSPLTRRLSDQPSDSSLRREDDCLLAAAPPTRAHSVSPSIIGRETRCGFDTIDRNSESGKFGREPSSSAKKFDRSLAVVSENQSSSDLAVGHLLAVGQPLVMPSSTRYSSKGLSTSSVGSLAVSFGTDSSTTRSSTASFSGEGSSDLSAKDSVFPEKSSSESEHTLPGVTDINHKFRTSCVGDDSVKENGRRRDSSVFMPASQESQVNHDVEVDAKSPENKLEQPTQKSELTEEIITVENRFHTDIDVSSSPLRGNESRALVSTVETSGNLGHFLCDEKTVLSPPSENSSVEVVDNTETTMSTEFKTPDGKISELEVKESGGISHVAAVCGNSELRNISGASYNRESELKTYQTAYCQVHGKTDSNAEAALANMDNLTDAQQLWTSKDNEAKVQFECLTAKSASDNVSPVQSLPSNNGCLDQTGALNGLVQDGHYGNVLSNGNVNQTTVLLAVNEGVTQMNEVRCEAAVETGTKLVLQSGTDVLEAASPVLATYSEPMAQSTSLLNAEIQSASTDCQGLALSSRVQSETPTQSTSVQSTAGIQKETVTLSSSKESKAAKQSASSSQIAAIKHLSSLASEDVTRSLVDHAMVVTHSADVQQSALILSRPSALPLAFSRTFTHLDDCGASTLKQRHSICSSSVRDYLQGTKKTFNSNDGKLRRSESRDLVKLHRTASLPLLPCP